MKNSLVLSVILIVSVFITTGCTDNKQIGMPNPWKDCYQSYECAQKITGFTFPLNLSNYTVRATRGSIDVTYPLDEFRDVTVRKTVTERDNGDNSGVYTDYPKNSQVDVGQEVMVNTRGDNDKIYVMYFCAESGCYSAYCEKGMSEKEVKDIFSVIKEVEEPKYP